MRRVDSTFRHALAAIMLAATSTAFVSLATGTPVDASSTVDIVGPVGSGSFGDRVIVLPNGNIVVADVSFDLPAANDVGAVYLYDGTTRQLISTLHGSTTNDLLGGRGIVEVGASNFVVISPDWSNGAATAAGAITWVNGATGLNGQVSAANSLVGTHSNDGAQINVTKLANGNYVVNGAFWDDGAILDVGAVTFGNGNTGVSGAISPVTSLVGTTGVDHVGESITPLTNGNYVVGSPSWNKGAVVDAGAATWASGVTGLTGPVTIANSLVGSTAGDNVGTVTTPLSNGNYVVGSYQWHNGAVFGAGAATWRSGAAPSPGVVSAANSLVGTTTGDGVGLTFALSDVNYVAVTSNWTNGAAMNAGAVTWGSGVTGVAGPVAAANSLVGTVTGDGLSMDVVPLTNGGYVVAMPMWDNGATVDAGAATWRMGGAPSSATPSAAISLVGTTAGDQVGRRVLALTNRNYVVGSDGWNHGGVIDAGAATWGSGTSGVVGPVSAANSLIGNQSNEQVGTLIVPLKNGNYVVGSKHHHFASNPDAGAVTWLAGTGPSPGVVTTANSLVGRNAGDLVGNVVIALDNGDYAVPSPSWDNDEAVDVGAVTLGSGVNGVTGEVSPTNSLTGIKAGDRVGYFTSELDDGTVETESPFAENGSTIGTGSVTFGITAAMVGPISSANTFFGTAAHEGLSLFVAGKGALPGRSFAIGRPKVNTVSFFTPSEFVSLTPARLADTRPGFATTDGIAAGGGLRDGGSTLELRVAGRGGVDAGALAVALNVTAVDAGGDGFVTVFPCGEPRPTASNLNMTVGSTVPNAVITKIGTAGAVCLFTSQPTHLVVDVNGYFPNSTSFHSANPARLLETRSGLTTIDGLQQGAGKNSAGGVIELQVTGRAGVPTDATSVVLNVTITEAEVPGFATAYPCGISPPLASNLNYVSGIDVANLTMTKVGAGGKVCVITSQAADVVADLAGYFPAVTAYTPLAPARLLETRPDLATVDGLSNGAGVRPAGTVTEVQVTGRAGVPAGATTAVVNVTASEAQGSGFVTVYPCGIEPPLASNLNIVLGSTVPNAGIVKVGADGKVCLFNSQPTHLIVDVSGYFIG